MFRRLFRRLRSDARPVGPAVNLFDESGEGISDLGPIGITTTPHCAAWTVARVERLVRRCNAQPGHVPSQLEGRHARHCLSGFWLTAPVDLLESLYRSPLGDVYRELLHGSLREAPLAVDEQAWKATLSRRLEENPDAPERVNLILAVMPYCASGRMRLANPLTTLPSWLLADYSRCFDPDLAHHGDQPFGLLAQPGAPALSAIPTAASADMLSPQAPGVMDPLVSTAGQGVQTLIAPLPQLSERRGTEAFALFQDNDFCDRMRGLINLFRMDPADRQVREELAQLRRLIGQVWLDVTPSSLESLYRSPMGAIYKELLASNFGSIPCEAEDLALRQSLTQVAIDQSHPAMPKALLAVMPFVTQGKMRLGSGRDRLPLWLQQDFAELSGLRSDG